MTLLEKITLDLLTENSVSILFQNCVDINGEVQEVGLPSRQAYVNSKSGREKLIKDIKEPYLSGVMSVWGNSPTVDESAYDEVGRV